MPLTPALPTMLAAVQPDAQTSATVGAPVDLTDTATVLRKTTARDAFGSVRDVWSDLPVTLPCKLSRSSGSRELAQTGEIRAQTDWTCVFNAGADVRPPDRLRIQNTLYEVTGTNAGISGAVQLIAQLRRIRR